MGSIQNLDVQIPHDAVLGVVPGLRHCIAAARRRCRRTFRDRHNRLNAVGWLLVFASGVAIAQAVMVGHWAAAEHHQNGSAFHADPRASGTGFGATFGISVSIDTSRYQQ